MRKSVRRYSPTVALVYLAMAQPIAQDAPSRLGPGTVPSVTLSLDNTDVRSALEMLASIRGFEVYATKDVDTLAPIDMRVEGADVQSVLRAILNGSDLTYRVVDDATLLVSRAWRVSYDGGRSPAAVVHLRRSLPHTPLPQRLHQ